MGNYSDRISAQTLAAALALGGGSSPSPTPGKVYQFAGSVPFLGLPALSADKVGKVYDVTDEFTSTTDFTDGGGKHYSAGTDVAIANTGTDESPVLKYNCLMGDLSEILDDIDDLKNASAEYPISTSASGTSFALTDAADGKLQNLVIKGRTDSTTAASVGDGGSVTVVTCGKNLFDELKALANSVITFDTGDVLTNAGKYYNSVVSDYILVEPNTEYKYFPGAEVFTVGICFYTSGLQYISGISCANAISADNTIITPSNAAYIRATFYTGDSPECYFGKASEYTAYEPYHDTSATITTGLPLRSYSDSVYDELDMLAGTVTKRCGFENNAVTQLATPYDVPLTPAEMSALTALETYSGATNISCTDNPTMTVDYLKDTDNGKAIAEIVESTLARENIILSENEIQAKINDRIYQGVDLTVKFATEIALQYSGDPWAWIHGRIQAENFRGIHVGDYIPFTTTNNVTLNAQIAGINTYKNYGDSAVGSHIDFICKEIWPTLHPVNKVNYNNGTADQNHAWLASDAYLYINSLAGNVPNGTGLNPETVAVDYTADGIYYYLPQQLKNVIVEKRFLLPKRYSASGLLSDDNAWAWVNIGKLWFPDEVEVYGLPVWGGKGGYSLGGSGLQYPIFAGNMNRLKYRNGSRYAWWLLSPYGGVSSHWCAVTGNGDCASSSASGANIGCPVCFRVA